MVVNNIFFKHKASDVSISTEIDLLITNMIIFSRLGASFLVKVAKNAKIKKKMSYDWIYWHRLERSCFILFLYWNAKFPSIEQDFDYLCNYFQHILRQFAFFPSKLIKKVMVEGGGGWGWVGSEMSFFVVGLRPSKMIVRSKTSRYWEYMMLATITNRGGQLRLFIGFLFVKIVAVTVPPFFLQIWRPWRHQLP